MRYVFASSGCHYEVHLASISHPIVGDLTYGSKPLDGFGVDKSIVA